MSDQRNPKDPLEHFFEKKAGEYKIPFREEDWNRMAGMLDLRDARIAYRRRVMWIVAASLLAVSLLGYFTFENYNRINQLARLINEIHVEESTPIPAENDIADQELLQPTTGDNEPGRLAQNVPGLAGEVPGEQESVEIDGIEKDTITPNDLPDVHEMLVSDGDAAVWAGNREGDATDWEMDAAVWEGNREVKAGAWKWEAGVRLADAAVWEGDPTVRLVDEAVLVNNVPPLKDPGMGAVRIDPAIISSAAADNQSRDGAVTGHQESLLSRISATLQMSPDLSTVGSVSNFSSPGYKTGITVQYRISRKWSVSTGVIRTEVRYAARGRDYDPPVYWPSGGGPEHMSAVCLLIDIPVSLRYDVLQFSGSRFFATAGLSSYIMLNEEYTFRYDGYEYGQLESWSGRTGTRHWLSNAGFSVGYELDVHPNWSLLAEPFIALPLREVGWGNVRLYSVGSYLSVRYRFGS